MNPGAETCWTLVRQTAEGDAGARRRFADAYLPVVRAFLSARWTPGPMAGDTDDAIQETFVEFFRDPGALARADLSGAQSFRGYLHAVSTNVARRFEERRRKDRRQGEPGGEVPAEDPRASQVFDRQWASAILRRAAARQQAGEAGDSGKRELELLRLRFQEGMPIRAIAEAWKVDPAEVHRTYATARESFRRALVAEIAWHDPGASPEALEAECRRILECLA